MCFGGLAGSQVGRGNGKTAMVVRAVGGALPATRWKARSCDKQYQVTVRFDDGSTRSYTETEAGQWQNGDRVRVENGQLVLLPDAHWNAALILRSVRGERGAMECRPCGGNFGC